jgi:hypothetical protein
MIVPSLQHRSSQRTQIIRYAANIAQSRHVRPAAHNGRNGDISSRHFVKDGLQENGTEAVAFLLPSA